MKRSIPLAIVVGLTLAACGSADTGQPDPAAATGDASATGAAATVGDDLIRVLYSPNSEQLAMFVADAEGMFADRGLNVELQEATQMEAALVGGSGELGLSTAPDILAATQEGLDLVFAAGQSVNTPANPRLFLMAGEASGITSVDDLEGRRIATISRGSFAELGTAILLEEKGVDVDSLSWIEMQFPAMNDALNEEVADAAVSVVPFTNFMEQSGHSPILDVSELADRVPIAVLAATREWASAHEAEIAAFREALDEAAAFIGTNADRAKEIEVQYTGLPPEIVEQIPFTTFSSTVSPDEVQLWIQILVDSGLLEPGLDAADMIVPPATEG